MTVYGNFEAIKQVFKTTHGSIWSARTAGTSEAPDCSIKLFQLDADMLENRDTTFAQNLLVAAALQQAMANKSEFWAPVYGLGSQGTNAFYVSRLFPRSAQTLVDFKTDLTSAELKIIMLAVIDGLMDLDTAFHRSHGNLKPANVLLADRAKIREGTVMLSDPDAAAEDRPSLTRTPDVKALGELLYALVTHNAHVTARYPLPKNAKWAKLGSTGKQWYTICGNLLNTASRRSMPRLENIRAMIDAVHPTPRRIPRSIIAVIVLIAVGSAAYAKKEQVANWYHTAATQVVALMHPPAKHPLVRSFTDSDSAKPAPTTQNTLATAVLPVTPANTEPTNIGPTNIGPTNIEPTNTGPSNTGPSATEPPKNDQLTVAPPPNAVANLGQQPSTLPVVVVPDPAKHKPIAIRPRLATHDDDAIAMVTAAPAPEFHSRLAKSEFMVRRNQFATAHVGMGANTTLSDWSRILAKLQTLDGDFPPMDPNATTGWPAGLLGIVNSRRDEALKQAIDASFDQQRVDPAPYKRSLEEVQALSTSVLTAREALARGDVTTARKAIDQYNVTLKGFPPEDADESALFGPIHQEFDALLKVQSTTDLPTLISVADNDAAQLGVRLAAWFRLGPPVTDPWPNDLASLQGDVARADRFRTLLNEAGSASLVKQVDDVAAARQTAFYSKLTDINSVLAMLKQTSDPQYASLLAEAPTWFQYDAALYAIRTSMPAQVTEEQKKRYSDLAGQVNAPGVALVHEVLNASMNTTPPSLAVSGPGAIKGWTIRGGFTRDHCTYISTSRGDTLEFIRVHLVNDPDGVDCYLCATEVPVALLQHLLSANPLAMSTAEALNTTPTTPTGGMRVWNFNDKTGNVELDNDNYRKCFVVSPSEQTPAQFVTPQLAFYLARRVGCRLPTSKEWGAALAQAKASTDPNMRGFATTGWKLRDHQFFKLLTNPNRDPNYWPDDNIFIPDTNREIVPRGGNAPIWTMTDLRSLGGSTTTDNATGAPWPLSTLQASGGFGFRTVGDDENYGGVFHDLVGNVAEFVMDVPVILEEKVTISPTQTKDETISRISDWFTPDHLSAVSVIGGSALSPPNEDPTKPYPLPASGPTQFADVGFRLAFTDPASLINAQRAVISQSNYLTAPTK